MPHITLNLWQVAFTLPPSSASLFINPSTHLFLLLTSDFYLFVPLRLCGKKIRTYSQNFVPIRGYFRTFSRTFHRFRALSTVFNHFRHPPPPFLAQKHRSFTHPTALGGRCRLIPKASSQPSFSDSETVGWAKTTSSHFSFVPTISLAAASSSVTP